MIRFLFCINVHYIPFTAAGLFILVGGAIVIFRPFRRNVHNFSNFVFIFLFLSAYEILLAIDCGSTL